MRRSTRLQLKEQGRGQVRGAQGGRQGQIGPVGSNEVTDWRKTTNTIQFVILKIILADDWKMVWEEGKNRELVNQSGS